AQNATSSARTESQRRECDDFIRGDQSRIRLCGSIQHSYRGGDDRERAASLELLLFGAVLNPSFDVFQSAAAPRSGRFMLTGTRRYRLTVPLRHSFEFNQFQLDVFRQQRAKNTSV